MCLCTYASAKILTIWFLRSTHLYHYTNSCTVLHKEDHIVEDYFIRGQEVAQLVKAPSYKPEVRVFSSRSGHLDFSLTYCWTWHVKTVGEYVWQHCHVLMPIILKPVQEQLYLATLLYKQKEINVVIKDMLRPTDPVLQWFLWKLLVLNKYWNQSTFDEVC